jgi:hypothetical protein
MEDTHLSWRKSSYSDNGGANCVEVADRDSTIMIRDTQARERGHLAVRAEQWRAFVARIKAASYR